MATPVYNSGSPVAVTVDIPLYAGSPLTPTAVSRTVKDETGAVISDDSPLPLPAAGDTSVQVDLDATVNDMPIGVPNAMRIVEVVFVAPEGTFSVTSRYVLKNSAPLVRMKNTFATLDQAEVTRLTMPAQLGWDSSSDDEKVAALVSAYRNMLQLRYRFPIGENSQSRIVDFYGMSTDNVFGRIYMVLADISFYTAEDFDGWTDQFKQALLRAQVAEADSILRGDPVADKRRHGIVSETIGESAMTFRNIPEVQFPVSRAAMTHLRGFLNNATLIARA